MKHFIVQYRIAIIVIVGVAAIGGIYWYVSSSAAPSFGTIAPQHGTIVQSIDESGNVLAENRD